MVLRSPLLVLALVAGCIPQVGPPVDGGLTQSEESADGGTEEDGGMVIVSPVSCEAFAGCTSFVDETRGGNRKVRFPGNGSQYSPRCMRVRLGQSVSFEGGDFALHTLAQSCGPVSHRVEASSGQRLNVTFDALGVFGYYCRQHGTSSGTGMAGAVEVIP